MQQPQPGIGVVEVADHRIASGIQRQRRVRTHVATADVGGADGEITSRAVGIVAVHHP